MSQNQEGAGGQLFAEHELHRQVGADPGSEKGCTGAAVFPWAKWS